MNTQPTTPSLLPHETLDVYHLALEFHRALRPLARQRGFANLRDQMTRAAESIVLNIAEGAGRTSRDDKRRFYEIAMGSTIECAAVLDCLRNRAAIAPQTHQDCRALAIRLYQILSRLTGPPR